MSDIITIAFCLALLANAAALVRHYNTMRAFNIALNRFIELQVEFNKILEQEKHRDAKPLSQVRQ